MKRSTASSLPLVMSLVLWVAGYGVVETAAPAAVGAVGAPGCVEIFAAFRVLQVFNEEAQRCRHEVRTRFSDRLASCSLPLSARPPAPLVARDCIAHPRIRGPTV